jgi:uncharacterized protein YjbI with pentapeptide repeats
MLNPATLNNTLKPLTYDDPLYQLLRDGNVAEFNRRKAPGQTCDLSHCDFRGLDLRGIDTNLRGVDFTKSRLEGASLNQAKISGAYFPPELSPAEIALSVEHGARMRYNKAR